jgi:hypothetical protein
MGRSSLPELGDYVITPGNFILVSVGGDTWVANVREEPLKLLVIDIVGKGQTNTVPRKWSAASLIAR